MNLLSFFGDKPFTQLKINQIERENIGVEIVWWGSCTGTKKTVESKRNRFRLRLHASPFSKGPAARKMASNGESDEEIPDPFCSQTTILGISGFFSRDCRIVPVRSLNCICGWFTTLLFANGRIEHCSQGKSRYPQKGFSSVSVPVFPRCYFLLNLRACLSWNKTSSSGWNKHRLSRKVTFKKRAHQKLAKQADRWSNSGRTRILTHKPRNVGSLVSE